MPVGVFFDGFSSTAEMLEVCREAEAAGASSLWFAQHMGYRDAIVWATAAASVTQRATLVPTAISPYLWPPLPVAMAIATLGEFAQGRVILNVSVGNILNLAESGIEPVKPIRVMREYVEALRALWTGKPVTQDGELHKLRGAKMVFAKGKQYPIYIASTGPQMLKLAGEIADGVLLSAGLTLAATQRCLELAEAGVRAKARPPAALRRASFINFNVSQRRRRRQSRDAAQARLPVPQPRPRRQHQLVQPRHRPSGDHRGACAARLRRRRASSCRKPPPTSLPRPARPRNAATAWSSIWRSASTSRSSKSPATPRSASSRLPSCARSRDDSAAA